MIKNELIIDESAIINRAKLFLGITADSKLSQLLDKQDNYISLVKTQGRVLDLYSILKICKEADFNWLITGEVSRPSKIVEIDENGKRKETLLTKESIDKIERMVEDMEFLLEKKTKTLADTQKQLVETNEKMFELQKLLAKYQLKDHEKE